MKPPIDISQVDEIIATRDILGDMLWLRNPLLQPAWYTVDEPEQTVLRAWLEQEQNTGFTQLPTWAWQPFPALSPISEQTNQFVLSGQVSYGPELQYFADMTCVCTFFMMTSKRDAPLTQETSTEARPWYRILAWNELGEICNRILPLYAHITVIGQIQSTWHIGALEEQSHYQTNLLAENLIIHDIVTVWTRRHLHT